MKKTILLYLSLILLFLGISACQPQKKEIHKQIGVIQTNMGDIKIKFYPDTAPKHVENFIKLAKSGFYDDTTFHRVIPDFVIQGGDPNSKDNDRSNDGSGGPEYTIQAEFNDKPHLRGTLSMARGEDADSAGSQFFICLKELPDLDHNYTVFGEVISGMDIADKIAQVKTDENDNPIKPVIIKKIIIEEDK